MKKFVLKVTSGPEYSFSFNRESRKYFFDEFHYHPEFELTLILKGKGTRFVGDSIQKFHEGDLILLGSNLPHVWRSDIEYYQSKKGLRCESITIHFSYDFLGREFFETPELRKIKNTLTKASSGLKITGTAGELIKRKLIDMERLDQTHRLFSFLEILDIISDTKSVKMLCTQSNSESTYSPKGDQRMTKVHNYIIKNFKDQMTLESIAKVANMTPSAFCRFFKQRTGRSFIEFVAQVRVNYACQLLQERRLKIAQVCYESGYNNISNFNRQFKGFMRLTPLAYRNQYST
jgi:AraC-like DNA-binding protein